MANPHCKWVCDRLPLMVGDELQVADRRRVERHLIGCTSCQQHRAALERALKVLHAGAVYSPTQADAPSIWPDLARQIRQSRRPNPPSLWSWSWSRFELWPAIGLCASLAVVAVVAVLGGTRHQVANARAQIALNRRPIVTAPVVVVETPAVAPVESSPETPTPSTESQPLPESVATTRLGYDLDHGTPMGTEPTPVAREKKQPTY